MLNKAIIVGHLGVDPELFTTQSGQKVCTLRVATSEAWKDKNGEKQEKTQWHRIKVWGTQADVCATYLKKGRQVLVEGRIEYSKNNDIWYTEIKADKVQFLGKKEGNDKPVISSNDYTEEEIPF
jgi:single-strand DNA-binding protein